MPAAGRKFPGAASDTGAALFQRASPLSVAVVNHQIIAGGKQPAGHSTTHAP